ncbi:UNVERIFIED_ORG: putative N-acyltransferase [Variovorax guangxiensis]
MRKTFQLQVEGKHPDRLLEAIKHEIRKYIKRERRRALPEGADFWDFDCRFGASQESAEVIHLSAITGLIDGVAKEAGKQFYIEILAKPGKRKPRPAGEAAASPDAED